MRIANTGRHIDPGEATALQDAFVRGTGKRTHTDGGAGLGLSIVRAIVRAHHGTLVTTARPGGGLDVTIELPSGPTETEASIR